MLNQRPKYAHYHVFFHPSPNFELRVPIWERSSEKFTKLTWGTKCGELMSKFPSVWFQDPLSVFSNNSRQIGIRVKHLPPGTVQFDTLIQENLEGMLVRLPFIEANGKRLTVSCRRIYMYLILAVGRNFHNFYLDVFLVRPITYAYRILLGRKLSTRH